MDLPIASAGKVKVFPCTSSLTISKMPFCKVLSPILPIYVVSNLIDTKYVIEYIARYSHRVAISNHRIKAFSDGKVTFS